VDDNFDDLEPTFPSRPRGFFRAPVTMAGAGIGVVLGAILVLKGFVAFLVALIFAIVGGAIARFFVAEP
jgi:uncharacterized membrane protein